MMTPALSLVCGLEIHAELSTNSKMFCGCANRPFEAAEPNIYTCPVCLGMPGGLPVPNRRAIEQVILLGLALNCKINLFSKFDRKHYFYPDLPKGYQISQYDIPFCESGYLDTPEGRVRIRRIHLEEDTAKLLHTKINGEAVSLIDFNRSGVPLVEIVTEADIISPAQAKVYAKKIRDLLRFLKVAECDMEEGGMRLEANISVQSAEERQNAKLPTYKVEVKNINSFRFLEQAISYEIDRQGALRAEQTLPIQETRGFSNATGETFSQRTKESAEDYRYFPDPDIPPIRFTQTWLDNQKSQMPELPDAVIARWEKNYQIEPRFAQLLVATQESVAWADQLFADFPEGLSQNELVKAMQNKKISIKIGDSVETVTNAFRQLSTHEVVDSATLTNTIKGILETHPDAVDKYRAGEQKVLGFLIGQIVRALKSKIDPKLLRAELVRVLES
jgi:aspartyl-tRNA(Asn)/glutamyl-tRNA(Gln) amidotransferase subunit B